MIARNFSEKNDISRLEKMIDQKMLPPLYSASEGWLLSKILKMVEKKEILLSTALVQGIKELSQHVFFKKIHKITEKFHNTKDLELCIDLLKQLESLFQNKKNGINFPLLKKRVHEYLEPKFSLIKPYEKILACSRENKKMIPCSYPTFLSLLEYFINENQWDKALEVYDVQMKSSQNFFNLSFENKILHPVNEIHLLSDSTDLTDLADPIIFNTLMDKKMMFNKNHLYRGCEEYRGIFIKKALAYANSQLENLGKTTVVEKNLMPLLEEFIVFDRYVHLFYESKEAIEKFIDLALDKLQRLEEGQSLLIPLPQKTHITSLLFTKTANETFEMIHYNTGLGVNENHYQWPSSSKHQTFDILNDIPKKSLLDKHSWKFLTEISFSDNMPIIYKCLYQLLGKGGKRQPPSPYEEDYEITQMSGTCTIQSLMAVLRHRLMQLGEGSLEEKKALYKLYKAEMSLWIAENFEHHSSSTIKKNLTTIKNKSLAEKGLVKAAENLEEFNNTLKTLLDALEQFGEGETANLFRKQECKNQLSRYALLRKVSIRLSLAWLKEGDVPEINSLENKRLSPFIFANAKFEHCKAYIANIDDNLHNFIQNKKQCIDLLKNLFLNPSFFEFSISILIKLSNEHDLFHYLELLFSAFNLNRTQNTTLVENIISRLKEKGESQIADKLFQYWEIIK